MKVGILTFHEVFNPGAFLQALGTQTLVRSLGHDAYIIDYNPPGHRYSTLKHIRKLSYRLPFRLRTVIQTRAKDFAFANDRAKYMSLTQKFYNHAELEKKQFDAVLIGADIVWNYDMKALGRDPVYFGHFLNAKRVIASSPSVGPCCLSGELPIYVVEGLAKFHAISVRDIKTQEFVGKVLNIKPPVLCDPAFHLDPVALLDCADINNLPKEPYVLVYLMGQFCDDAFIAEVKAFAHKNKLRIISTLYSNKWADENRVVGGAMDWLQLIANAEHVITNTFHGTVFSIMLNKSFAVQYTHLIQSKTDGMLSALTLKGRVIQDDESLGFILGSSWDFHAVSSKVEQWKNCARSFIQNALEDRISE
jgi:hypothetical protein